MGIGIGQRGLAGPEQRHSLNPGGLTPGPPSYFLFLFFEWFLILLLNTLAQPLTLGNVNTNLRMNSNTQTMLETGKQSNRSGTNISCLGES